MAATYLATQCLDVVLVNAKSQSKPNKADSLRRPIWMGAATRFRWYASTPLPAIDQASAKNETRGQATREGARTGAQDLMTQAKATTKVLGACNRKKWRSETGERGRVVSAVGGNRATGSEISKQ